MTSDNTSHAQTRSAAAQAAQKNLDCSLSVNAILARYPSTLPVFNRFGLDTCCGGGLSVGDAAHAADVDAEVLCGALRDAIVT
jgi:iron-sulfur cluster repair protein YtfE (RIC family)